MIYVILLFAVLFMAFIVYNLYSNYKSEQERNRRRKIARYKEIIDETDELLLNTNHLPYTKTLVIMLQNRILTALNNILECNPTLSSIRSRTADIKKQIDYVSKNYTQGEDNPFIAPTNDRQAVQMLKITKKLRKVLRIEHTKGKVDHQAYNQEDARLEMLQVKINVTSLMTHLQNAHMQRQWGTCKQLISMGNQLIGSIAISDPWLEGKKEEINQINQSVNAEIDELNKKDLQDTMKKETDSDMDFISGVKKKW